MSSRLGCPDLLDLVPASAVSRPRLHLDPTGFPYDLLDGAWWPHSTDASAELPGLVMAIDGIHGEVESVLLGADGWRSGPQYMHIGGRRISVRYHASQPASLLTAVYHNGRRINLLVVTPLSAEFDAVTVMHDAATTGNRMTQAHRTATRRSARRAGDLTAVERWNGEGGHS
jgi:hypothetical protein